VVPGAVRASVTIGLLKPADLAGYRNGQVYIRKSMHVPPNRDAVRDAMPAFFDLLREEPHPAVRVALGHFIFVYIHPYMDGNGRVGRFLMNTMMASGGYPWTVIPVTDRNAYVKTLEKASVGEDIAPFANFLVGLVKKRLAGEPLPVVPKASPVDERQNNSRSAGSAHVRVAKNDSRREDAAGTRGAGDQRSSSS